MSDHDWTAYSERFDREIARNRLEDELEELRMAGWQEPPLPPPVHEGFILVEFGFALTPDDRDRYTFAGCWTHQVYALPPDKVGKWISQGGMMMNGQELNEANNYRVVRWLWLRGGPT